MTMYSASTPPSRGASRDLNDAEFDELDDLLAQTPEPLQPLNAIMLDGYLCGVLVQPRLIGVDEWLPHIFDYEGQSLPDGSDPAWLDRISTLASRRHAALGRDLAESGWFDPLVLDESALTAQEQTPDVGPLSRPLLPWVAGFHHATLAFPELSDLPGEAIGSAIARLFRHLPAETDEERELLAMLDRDYPLKDADDAVEEMVAAVAELEELTREQRYLVETVRRDVPKVGRNDPCPCGSGRKFKACHGKT